MSLPYTILPPEAWRQMGVNAGVLLSAFDLTTGTARREDIIGATVGPVQFTARPRLRDFGAGAGCPMNARELLGVEGWDVRLSGTFLSAGTGATRRLLALADIEGGRVAPRGGIPLPGDFGEVWYVFDYGVRAGAPPGRYAIHMINVLSTGGFAVRTEARSRARWPFEFTAFCALDAAPPFEVYVSEGGTVL